MLNKTGTSTIWSLLSIVLILVLTSCVERTAIDSLDPPKTMKSQSHIRPDRNAKPIKIDNDKIISANGTENFTLHNTIEEIESKSGMSLNLEHTINECSMDSSNSEFQLLFLRDTLISVEFFDSSYQTSKGFKVNDNISKLLSTHPEVEYHEYTSNMGDESYYMTNRYYTTRPNAQGNTLTFNVSDRYPDTITDTDPNTISSISVSNNLDDSSICSVY